MLIKDVKPVPMGWRARSALGRAYLGSWESNAGPVKSAYRRSRVLLNEVLWVSGMCLVLVLNGCSQQMADQPRAETYESSGFFADGRSARLSIPGTVARGSLRERKPFYTGKHNGELIQGFPMPIDRHVIERGQERFGIFCTPCHDAAGTGLGIVVRRGFRQPSSFHIDRLREAPVGYFFDVITNGFGTMASYAAQVRPQDRWAIVAYIRALQLSQYARDSDVPPEDMKRLEDGSS